MKKEDLLYIYKCFKGKMGCIFVIIITRASHSKFVVALAMNGTLSMNSNYFFFYSKKANVYRFCKSAFASLSKLCIAILGFY